MKKKKTNPFLENLKPIKEKQKKKLLYNLELIVIVVFSIIMLILLCNRTFFRTNYKNSKIKIDIPLLMFFRSDKDNKLVLKTLRKTQYIKDYFDGKLSNMTKYNCVDHEFYYDEINRFAIYSIDIKKNKIIKTISIEYAAADPNCLCDTTLIGKEAEDFCNR